MQKTLRPGSGNKTGGNRKVEAVYSDFDWGMQQKDSWKRLL